MDFAKFTSLVSTGTLYFARADAFNDPFEGAMGAGKNQKRWNNYYVKEFGEIVASAPGHHAPLSVREKRREGKRLLDEMSKSNEQILKRTFISCWYESVHESDAMWRLYSRDNSQGVAIATTVGRLYSALGTNPDIEIGRVRYIDFSKSFAPVNEAFFFKRIAFSHEREVRALIRDFGRSLEGGMAVPVKLSKLIASIHVSPFAPQWFHRVVEDTTTAFKLQKPVRKSKLSDLPFR